MKKSEQRRAIKALEELIDRALDKHVDRWYHHNESTNTTTVMQHEIVKIVVDTFLGMER